MQSLDYDRVPKDCCDLAAAGHLFGRNRKDLSRIQDGLRCRQVEKVFMLWSWFRF